MKSKTPLFLFMLSACIVQAQEKIKDLTPSLVTKGTFNLSFHTNLSAGFSSPELRFITPSVFNPKISYFFLNRLSLGLSYQGVFSNFATFPKYKFYHNAELELNYYLYAKKNVLWYTQAGFSYGQYYPDGNFFRESAYAKLKLGAGVSWRFKKNPNFGINLEAAYYLNQHLQSASRFPNLTFGLSYFFNRKKVKHKLAEIN